MKRRTAAERNRHVEANRRKAAPPTVAITGVDDVDPDVLAFLDSLLAEGRALVRSRGSV